MLGKKANAAVVVLIIIIIVLIIIWIVEAVNRGECKSDLDCGAEHYCDVHRDCKKIPVIEKTISPVLVEKKYNFTLPSILLGLAIIVGAAILKNRRDQEDNFQPEPIAQEPQPLPKFQYEPITYKTNTLVGAIVGGIIVCVFLLILLLIL